MYYDSRGWELMLLRWTHEVAPYLGIKVGGFSALELLEEIRCHLLRASNAQRVTAPRITTSTKLNKRSSVLNAAANADAARASAPSNK